MKMAGYMVCFVPNEEIHLHLKVIKVAAIAQCGIARTKDLKKWERLPDLKTPSPQQRNVVLHPEFVNGKYAFYTSPQDSFIEAGKGGGIGFGLSDKINDAVSK